MAMVGISCGWTSVVGLGSADPIKNERVPASAPGTPPYGHINLTLLMMPNARILTDTGVST